MKKIFVMLAGVGALSASASVLNLSSSTLDLVTGSSTSVTNYSSAFSVQNKALTSSDVMVIGTFSTKADVTSGSGRWRLGYGTQYSTQINRSLDGRRDTGIASVVHVFSNVNAGATINLEHSSSSGANITTLGGNLVAIPLSVSTGEKLNYGIDQQASGFTTGATAFQDTGVQASVLLERASNNGVYMAASFNSQAVSASGTGSWQLQYGKVVDGSVAEWSDTGSEMRRAMNTTNDQGSVTMYALEEGLEAGEYAVRLVSRSADGGSVETLNGTLAAVSLSYTNATGGGYFDGFMATNQVLSDAGGPYTGAQGTLNLASEESDIFAAMSFESTVDVGNGQIADFDLFATNGLMEAVNQANERYFDNAADLGSGASVGYYTNFVAGDVTVLGRHDDLVGQVATSDVTLVGFATEAIPEPTVMALIALFGSGFLFIRRWFK